MKLIIQIPCLNEEKTLPITIKDIPRKIEGISKVEILIIDDGSSDRTIEVAKKLGVDHVVRFPKNKGLAEAFKAGLDASLKLGADIIVNTDADNQYKGSDIPKLIKPILEKKFEMVIGDRKTDTIAHFSPIKKFFQRFGSRVVRILSQTDVPDSTSGFRAYSRDAALRINVVSEFTYTLETIIQAGHKKISVGHVEIGTNGKLRESRLFKSIYGYMKRSAKTIIRIYTMYRPMKVFMTSGFILFMLGVGLGVRFLIYYFLGDGNGHIQSLILSAAMMIIGFQLGMLGLVADLISNNRKLMEETLYRIRKIELQQSSQLDEGLRQPVLASTKQIS
ncbi:MULTISPECIES: glycosyltransferase [unclassified Paenibacillus]|uniref:glycosyltransferase n=1 Tax=unclassified Paenibacillus TaxID=185978 RepID=UPI001AE75B7C|nr:MULTISPECIES: glycosyltransferase [unclassified Paenibacillus]MBP1157463.1 glycosyltransferase involved in cell wall biosynthesis [Paenibacillus sp. PvP091]MBP1171800.1 glycosyltransferase involved in cell wall biosynthesis [Paenibacillus sp. PvR098]MBP2438181.1 glycosyltransferase involved in cell wall biosynthesis [Paenibacillus sp. PvP052]